MRSRLLQTRHLEPVKAGLELLLSPERPHKCPARADQQSRPADPPDVAIQIRNLEAVIDGQQTGPASVSTDQRTEGFERVRRRQGGG